VLSQADLSVIALTYQYEVLENGSAHIRTELGQKKPTGQAKPEAPSSSSGPQASGSNGGPEEAQVEAEDEGEDSEDDEESEGESVDEEEEAELDDVEQVTQSIEQVLLDSKPEDQLEPPLEQDTAWSTVPTVPTESSTTLDDEDEESDGGEWITPANVTTHRNHDLGLLPADNGKAGEEAKPLAAACMTGDFAVQNVLLGMGLGLVGEGGKRIGKVKSFVLRCHACFK
jgi:RNA-binding protein NOB1